MLGGVSRAKSGMHSAKSAWANPGGERGDCGRSPKSMTAPSGRETRCTPHHSDLPNTPSMARFGRRSLGQHYLWLQAPTTGVGLQHVETQRVLHGACGTCGRLYVSNKYPTGSLETGTFTEGWSAGRRKPAIWVRLTLGDCCWSVLQATQAWRESHHAANKSSCQQVQAPGRLRAAPARRGFFRADAYRSLICRAGCQPCPGPRRSLTLSHSRASQQTPSQLALAL